LAYDQLDTRGWPPCDGARVVDDTYPNAYAEIKALHLGGLPNRPINSFLKDYRYTRTQNAALNKTSISFAEFPVLETRLRQLRHYMDTQRPRGIRQLWRDNRDSSNYYTFWLVVGFGLLSVTLAMFSLAVSAAQTWASFRALDMSSSPSVSSP
jgi:hypothetical protein